MHKGRRVAVVVPAYNVAKHVAEVLEGIPDIVDHVILVDDAATDGTAEAAARVEDPRLTILRHPRNLGVGGAMVTGYKEALRRGTDVIVKMDGDGQMDPRYLASLVDTVVGGGYAYAKGNRFLDNEQLGTMPKLRLVGNFILTFLTKLASGYWNIFDPQNGYLAIDARTLERIPLDRLARRYFFENDMLIHLNILRARVKDVPIPARYGDERSSMRLSQILATFPLRLFARFWYRLYHRHILRDFSAVAVFWIAGVALLTWGTVFGAIHWIKSIATGHVASTGTVMLSALPFILGFQLILQAIVIEIHESSGP